MPRVFFSHSSLDRAIVTRIASDLRERGIDVWLADWEIRIGDDIREKIERALTDYEYFAIALSAEAVKSRWVQHELSAALIMQIEQNRTKILPLKIGDCRVPPLIAAKRYADFSQYYDEGFRELLRALESVTCHDRAIPGSRTSVARRGWAAGTDQRIAYAAIGAEGLFFHWLIEGVSTNQQLAVTATQAAHDVGQLVVNKIFADCSTGKPIQVSPPVWIHLLLGSMNTAVYEQRMKAPRQEVVGAKAVVALRVRDDFFCGEIGMCGGLSCCSEPIGPQIAKVYRRIDSRSVTAVLSSREEMDIAIEAPLGFLEPEKTNVSCTKISLRKQDDFVALTSFVVPPDDTRFQTLLESLEHQTACGAARVICASQRPPTADCLCAVISYST